MDLFACSFKVYQEHAGIIVIMVCSKVNVKSSAPCQIMRRCSLAALTVTFSWKFFRPWHDRLQHCFIYIPVFIFSLYQLCQQISDIIINIHVIRTGCLRYAVNDRTCLRSSDCIDRYPVFPADCKIPQLEAACILGDCIVILLSHNTTD